MTFEREWINEVKKARLSILASKRDPVKLLVDLFQLYEDDFDVDNLKNNHPELYRHLKEFCSNPPSNTTELKTSCPNLANYFNNNKLDIRRGYIELYYALLNFMDMLKQRRIYF